MKMNYLWHNNSGDSHKSRNSLLIALALLVILGGVRILIPQKMDGLMQQLAEPIWSGQKVLTEQINTFFAYFHSKRKLSEHNQQLEEKLRSAKAELARLDMIKNQMEELKKICGREGEGSRGITAAVLKKPGSSPYDTLIIDMGSKDGVEEGDIVVAKNSVIIGKISKVYNSTSKVTLFSSPGETTTVILSSSGREITVKGKGGGNFAAKVPQSSRVREGDHLVIPGMNSKILSTIKEIQEKPTSPYKHLLFRTPINIFELSWVKVITKEQ